MSFVLGTMAGTCLLVWSAQKTGITRDGMISGGVALIAFAGLSLIIELRPPDPTWYRKVVNTTGFYGGCGTIILATQLDSEWWRSFLLEAGIAILFIAAIEVLFDHFIDEAEIAEHTERELWTELVLRIALMFQLSTSAYHRLQTALDKTPSSSYATAAERAALVLRYARAMTASDPPGAADPATRAKLERHARVTSLAANVAASRGLSDSEFFYLLNAATIRSDPETPHYSKAVADDLENWIGQAASHIAKNRPPRSWRGWLAPALPDSLLALDGVRAYYPNGFATPIEQLASPTELPAHQRD